MPVDNPAEDTLTVWIVAGPTGSGKTTLALALAHITAEPYCHIGSLLLAELRSKKLDTEDYRSIGPRYIDAFGVERYSELVATSAGTSSILDGMRLIAPLELLRKRADVVLVYRDGPTGATKDATHGDSLYEADLAALRVAANTTIPWLLDAGLVSDAAEKLREKH